MDGFLVALKTLNISFLYLFYGKQYNDVADKRRPRTTMPLKKQLPIILEHLFNRTTLQSNNTRKNKANNCTNAKCENGVRLIGGLYLRALILRASISTCPHFFVTVYFKSVILLF